MEERRHDDLDLIRAVARIEAKLEDLSEMKADIKELRNSQTTQCDDCEPARGLAEHLRWHEEEAKKVTEVRQSNFNWTQFLVNGLIALTAAGAALIAIFKK